MYSSTTKIVDFGKTRVNIILDSRKKHYYKSSVNNNNSFISVRGVILLESPKKKSYLFTSVVDALSL